MDAKKSSETVVAAAIDEILRDAGSGKLAPAAGAPGAAAAEKAGATEDKP